MIPASDIVIEAREWLGTPFHHQGRAKGRGVDCIGLAVGCLRELGIPTYDPSGYAREPDGTLERELFKRLELIEIQPGALLLFRIRRNPQHVAIATDYGMIHSYIGTNKVVEHVIDQWWQDRLITAYALPGVQYVTE